MDRVCWESPFIPPLSDPETFACELKLAGQQKAGILYNKGKWTKSYCRTKNKVLGWIQHKFRTCFSSVIYIIFCWSCCEIEGTRSFYSNCDKYQTVRTMAPPSECRCGLSENSVSYSMEDTSCLRCDTETQMLVASEPNQDLDVHKRNLSTVASPVILLFDGFHNLVYHIFLATRLCSDNSI